MIQYDGSPKSPRLFRRALNPHPQIQESETKATSITLFVLGVLMLIAIPSALCVKFGDNDERSIRFINATEPGNSRIALFEMPTTGLVTVPVTESIKSNDFDNSLPSKKSILSGSDTVQILSIVPEESMAATGRTVNGTKKSPKFKVVRAVSATRATAAMRSTTLTVSAHEISIPGFLAMTIKIDYELQGVIGRGAGGDLHLVSIKNAERKRQINTAIVGKEIAPSVDDLELYTLDAFFQEVAIMWRFRDDPYIAKIYGYSESPAMILMKYYRCGSLNSFIHAGNAVSIGYTKHTILNIITDIIQGVKLLHNADITHGDLKPSNVLLDLTEGKLRAVLSDFGLSQVTNPSSLGVHGFRVSNLLGGSFRYAGPEMIGFIVSDDFIDPTGFELKASDIYQVSSTMYELLTRRLPWTFHPEIEQN
jgi:hypothetical protein